MKLSRYLFVFLMGFFAYSFVEVAGRGYTHWTMCLTGGLVLSILYALTRRAMPLVKTCLIGTAVITGIEFVVGIFDNIIMHWEVWDYSELPLNVLGQICPIFSLLWFILCIPAIFICKHIGKRFGD